VTTYYRARVSSGVCVSLFSSVATVIVNRAPIVSNSPTNQTVCSGALVSFSSMASGTPAPTIQWQMSANGGGTWNNISGATAGTYSFTASLSANGYQYRAVFSNACGTVNSDAATLSLIPYTVTTSALPVAGGTPRGGGVMFCGSNVTVYAGTATHYHFIGWTEDGTPVSPNTSYNFTVARSRNLVAQFDQAPIITGAPFVTNALLVINNRTMVVAGETNIFNVVVTDLDGDPLTYQWAYGDGVTDAWSSVALATHVYAPDNCGPYSASVTVSDGHLTASSNLDVMAACDLTITKLQVGLNFAKNNWNSVDSASLKVKLDLPGITSALQLTGLPVIVGVGGVQVPFALDNKGRGAGANGTCVLAYTKPTKKLAGFWTATVTLSKGYWRPQWANYGLDNASHKSPGVVVTLPVVVMVGGETFAAEPQLHYTATLNKTGTAK